MANPQQNTFSERCLSPTSEILQHRAQSKPHSTPVTASLKRKRDQEFQFPSPSAQELPAAERARTSLLGTTERQLAQAEEDSSTTLTNPVQHWVLNASWPDDCFVSDFREGDNLFEHDSWLENIMAQPPAPVVQYVEENGFRRPLPIPRARQRSSNASRTPTTTTNRKNCIGAQYHDPRYPVLLAAKGSYMDASVMGISDSSQEILKVLMRSDQTVPTESLFSDGAFQLICQYAQGRNEAFIVLTISPYIVPPAEHLAAMGDSHLSSLIGSVMERWTESIPLEGPQPQPDYSLGFNRSAFTEEQLDKLIPLVGSVWDTSYFVATFRVLFPFLTCEVESGATTGLDVADRQNAHSMTLAARGVIELYKAVGREKELHREILAISVSHDYDTVRIHGHYAIIAEKKRTTFHCHRIIHFSISSEEGKDKWTAYKFIRNVYDIWMPMHFKRICSAIDQLPSGIDFEVPSGPET